MVVNCFCKLGRLSLLATSAAALTLLLPGCAGIHLTQRDATTLSALAVSLPPPVIQTTNLGCGPASGVYIARYWGHDEIDVATVERTYRSGMQPADLSQFLNACGLNSFLIRADTGPSELIVWDEIAANRPVILCVCLLYTSDAADE